MLAALRRYRVLAAALLALSPGVTAPLLPLLHPCPVDMPTLLRDASAGSAAEVGSAHHASHHAPGAPGHHSTTCHCPGTCCPSAALVALPVLATLLVRLQPAAATPASPRDWSLPAAHPTALHPPATAPPTLV